MSLTTYSVGEDAVALLRLDRPEARNAINTAMLDELLARLASARDDHAVRVLVLSSSDHMGLSAGADVREQLDEEGRVHRMQLFADLYDDADGIPKADDRRLPRCLRRRRRRDRGRLRSADRRLESADAVSRRGARRPRRPSAPGHALRPLGRQVPAADREGGGRRDGAALGPRSQGCARAGGPRTPALQLAAQVAEHPPEAVARLKWMLHEWDDVEGRSRVEGEGQVEWQRSGPGLPYLSG